MTTHPMTRTEQLEAAVKLAIAEFEQGESPSDRSQIRREIIIGRLRAALSDQPESTEQLIKGAIDETREMVAALPQELFDLRAANADLQRRVKVATSVVKELLSRNDYCNCASGIEDPCVYCRAHDLLKPKLAPLPAAQERNQATK